MFSRKRLDIMNMDDEFIWAGNGGEGGKLVCLVRGMFWVLG